ncbi:hypothetical protein ACGF5G_09300, partial [Micromonospora sp. NPDC047730]
STAAAHHASRPDIVDHPLQGTKDPKIILLGTLSGPHDYGFGLSRSDGSAMSRPEMEEAIRDFLAQIDPATGYLAE